MDQVFDALAHPIRRRVLELLKSGAMSAGALADAFPVTKPTMSAHFAKLKAAGLIQGENRGGSILYSLNLSVMEEVVLGFMGRLRVGKDVPNGIGPDETAPGETAPNKSAPNNTGAEDEEVSGGVS